MYWRDLTDRIEGGQRTKESQKDDSHSSAHHFLVSLSEDQLSLAWLEYQENDQFEHFRIHVITTLGRDRMFVRDAPCQQGGQRAES